MDPQTSTLLSGMGQWAGLGATTGALGMGAANLLQPNDPNDNQHHKSLLKSMLLGGALGGVAGGGSRAIYDTFSQEAANDPGPHLAQIIAKMRGTPEGTTPPHSSQANLIDQMMAGQGLRHAATTMTAATGAGVLSKILRKSQIGTAARAQGLDPDMKKVKMPEMSHFKAGLMSPTLHAFLAGVGAYSYGNLVNPGMVQEQAHKIPQPPQ